LADLAVQIGRPARPAAAGPDRMRCLSP